MNLTFFEIAVLCSVVSLVVLPGFGYLGYRSGRSLRAQTPDGCEVGTGATDAAVLSIWGLLIAFTFSNAYSRFEQRRALIVKEANAIGTAYLRLDLLPAPAQAVIRPAFRSYVECRFRMWETIGDRQAWAEQNERCTEYQDTIWKLAVVHTESNSNNDARKLLLPSINEMIDVSAERWMMLQAHPPLLVFAMLAILGAIAAWILGFCMSTAPVVSYRHLIGFAVVNSLCVYMILDIEFPRYGTVTLTEANQQLLELADHMPSQP